MDRYKKKMTSGTLHVATVGPTFCNCWTSGSGIFFWKSKGRGKEETGKRKGKGEERGKKNSVSHGPFLMPKVIVFVIILPVVPHKAVAEVSE